MKIDLFYYTPYFNNYYFVYGPEKDLNGDIIIKPTGYYFAEANDMVAKLRSMADSLAPEITNVQARNQGNSFWIYVGDLNTGSSDVPDYTTILTAINVNLTNLNSKFVTDENSTDYNIAFVLKKIFYCFQGESLADNNNVVKNNSFIRRILNSLNNIISCLSDVSSAQDSTSGSFVKSNSFLKSLDSKFITQNYNISKIIDNCLTSIYNTLRQSVSPNASITDVISALNATIDSKQDTTIVNNEVTPLAEINIDVPFEVKNLKKSDVENL